MNACPYCGRLWEQHSTRCEAGVPQVDLQDDRGLAGKVISGYTILGGIGKGGMGTVYLALDNITEGQLDAVKILNRDLLVDRERLRREAVTANRVDHPNVCRIYNYVEAYDAESSTALTLIAMELVRGPTLREVQEERGGVLELSRAALVVKEVAAALTAIHSQNIVHRDIKPTNIIVTRTAGSPERVKIVDFGIAKAVGGGAGQDLTEPGFVAATVHYASPELLRGRPEERSDIYALGVVLYEVLTGRRPFEATNQAELFSMILDPSVRAPTLEEARPGMGHPEALQRVLDRALERDPEQRYSSAAEFSEAVMGLVPQLAETVRVPVADLPPEPQGDPVTHVSPAQEARPATGPGPGGSGDVLPGSAPTPEPVPGTSHAGRPDRGRGGMDAGVQGPPRPPPAWVWGASAGALAVVTALFFVLGGMGLFGGGASPATGPFSLRPGSVSVGAGEVVTLALSRGGEETGVDAGDARWMSRDPEVARVDDAGAVTGGRVGTTTVLAIMDTDSAEASIRVVPGSPATLSLDPTSLVMAQGAAERVEATVTDVMDNPVSDVSVRWTSESPLVASVDSSGMVRGRSPGSAVIRAEVGGAWNQLSVEVRGSGADPGRNDPPGATCPDPAMEVLDRLELAMDDPGTSRSDVRAGALACWNRGGALSDSERAYAAWLVGLNTVEIEGCSSEAIRWLDRAVQLEPGSESYRVARQACGGEES